MSPLYVIIYVITSLGPSPQVNSTSVRKQEGKKAATAGADQKSAAKSSSVSKPTPGESEELQFVPHLLFLLSY